MSGLPVIARRSFERRFFVLKGVARLAYPDKRTYLQLAEEFNLVPVYQDISADLDTPISLYKKMGFTGPSFLLESVEGGRSVSRYSFIGGEPFAVLESKDGVSTLGGHIRPDLAGNPLAALKTVLERFKAPRETERFTGGAVGYLSYDLVRFLERLPEDTTDDLTIPDLHFMFPGLLLIYDHLFHRLTLAALAPVGDNPADAYDRLAGRLAECRARLARPLAVPGEAPSGEPLCLTASLTRAEYMDRVERAKEYIRAGDILQVVPSVRFSARVLGDPFSVYRRLRSLNPSPYLYYLDFGAVTVVGSSPEMLVRVEGDTVTTRPIAGTRPRGADAGEDRRLAAELLADGKERAEHLMLLDLGRNDVGKVAGTGSVNVDQFMTVENYSHVMHLVSAVSGRLRADRDAFDALAAILPAGTVSGAPKVKAMSIIEELEKTRRGIYAGAVGYFGFNGNMDTAIAIRTIVIKDGMAHVQAGSGIVADSDPQAEYREVEAKARALLNTLVEGVEPAWF
ncbi:MAG: anthranilate synthase component I [Peptococcaceae bacterium]|jgi:anthranilate synthase component 1|nr:anthranilate synthase component I [Peptococcaceae bacterium]